MFFLTPLLALPRLVMNLALMGLVFLFTRPGGWAVAVVLILLAMKIWYPR